MLNLFSSITALSLSVPDRLTHKAKAPYFRDALSTRISQQQLTPSELQYAIFNYMPSWVNGLMTVRNKIVSVFGFDVGQDNMRPTNAELEVGERAGFLTIIEKHEDEIISHADDKHMTFYLSVKKQGDSVIISTLVNKKTFIGRVYVTAITPFHYVIARAVINNAIKAKRI